MTRSIKPLRPARLIIFWFMVVSASALTFEPTQAQSQTDVVVVANGVSLLPAEPWPATRENGARNGNIVFITGPRGVVVWNTGVSYEHGRQALEKISSQATVPIRLVVISHAFQDVLFGWQAFADSGIAVWMHRGAHEMMLRRCQTCLHRLEGLLGDQAMRGTELVKPDKLLRGIETVDLIGRPLEILDYGHSSGPNDLMLFDVQTGTLMSGPLVATSQVPAVRDARLTPWITALKRLQRLPVKRVVPDYGRPGTRNDIDRTIDYLSKLTQRVQHLLTTGVTLSAATEAGQLPEFAEMTGYGDIHARNIQQIYLRLEDQYLK